MSTLQDKMRNNVYAGSGPGVFDPTLPHTKRPQEDKEDFVIKQDVPEEMRKRIEKNGPVLIKRDSIRHNAEIMLDRLEKDVINHIMTKQINDKSFRKIVQRQEAGRSSQGSRRLPRHD